MYIYIGSWEKLNTNKRILLTLLTISLIIGPLFWIWQILISFYFLVILSSVAIIFVIVILVILGLAGGPLAKAQRRYNQEMRDAEKEAEIESIKRKVEDIDRKTR